MPHLTYQLSYIVDTADVEYSYTNCYTVYYVTHQTKDRLSIYASNQVESFGC